jgi:hypothetical protein
MIPTEKNNQGNAPKPEISNENLQIISECFESLVEYRNEVIYSINYLARWEA